MTEVLAMWLLAVGGGGTLAAMYFASLWWTVQRVVRTGHSGLLVGSYLVRVPVTSLALLGIASGDALRLLAALAAFVVVRMVLARSVRAGALLASTAGMHAEER